MRLVFPHSIHLLQDNSITLHFEAGVHEVPDELCHHWWLKANDVRPTLNQ